MPMNFVASGLTRLKSVRDITNEATIGPAVNSRSPTSQGLMNRYPHSASRRAGRSVSARPGGLVAGSSSMVAVIGRPRLRCGEGRDEGGGCLPGGGTAAREALGGGEL